MHVAKILFLSLFFLRLSGSNRRLNMKLQGSWQNGVIYWQKSGRRSTQLSALYTISRAWSESWLRCAISLERSSTRYLILIPNCRYRRDDSHCGWTSCRRFSRSGFEQLAGIWWSTRPVVSGVGLWIGSETFRLQR